MKLKNPVLIGFGIKDRSSFSKACSYANGAIIGTAYIKILENATGTEIPARTHGFYQFTEMKIVIIKYNAGNIQSVLFALERIGVEALVTDDPDLNPVSG